MNPSKFHTPIAVWSLAVLVMSCSSGRKGSWETTSGDLERERGTEGGKSPWMSVADEAWAERADEDRALAAVAAWERAATNDPADVEALTRLSRGYYYYADCFLRFDPAKRAEYKRAHDRGARAAERALSAMSPEFAQRMRSGHPLDEVVGLLSSRAVPALYWRSANLDRWASADGLATVLAHKDEGRAAMEFCLERDREYFYGGADRYLGAFFASSPSFVGGDMGRSRAHFERSLASHPNYLATRTLYAEHWAVKQNERALFQELLTVNVNADPASLPRASAENLCEQRKSRALLQQTEELF